jgi:hypothetical protein
MAQAAEAQPQPTSPATNPIIHYGLISFTGDLNGNVGSVVPNSPVPSKKAVDR